MIIFVAVIVRCLDNNLRVAPPPPPPPPSERDRSCSLISLIADASDSFSSRSSRGRPSARTIAIMAPTIPIGIGAIHTLGGHRPQLFQPISTAHLQEQSPLFSFPLSSFPLSSFTLFFGPHSTLGNSPLSFQCRQLFLLTADLRMPVDHDVTYRPEIYD